MITPGRPRAREAGEEARDEILALRTGSSLVAAPRVQEVRGEDHLCFFVHRVKEQRGMRRVRLRGLSKASGEIAWACTAFNLTRLWRQAVHA